MKIRSEILDMMPFTREIFMKLLTDVWYDSHLCYGSLVCSSGAEVKND